MHKPMTVKEAQLRLREELPHCDRAVSWDNDLFDAITVILAAYDVSQTVVQAAVRWAGPEDPDDVRSHVEELFEAVEVYQSTPVGRKI